MLRSPALLCLALAACTADGIVDPSPRDHGARTDPSLFVATAGQPSLGRTSAVALVLPDGRVLVAGGFTDAGAPLAISEVFSPATDRWTGGPTLSAARGKSATEGTLVLGGLAAGPRLDVDALAVDGGFVAQPSMAQARSEPSVAVLPTGAVLVMGGRGASAPLSSAELFVDGGAWVGVPGLVVARAGATATLLNDGRVLVAGGMGATGPLQSTELREVDGGFHLGPAMLLPRVRHTATLLLTGDVLLVGGDADAGSRAELFQAASTSMLTLPAGPAQPRAGHTATLLTNGEVLIAGGAGANAGELYSSASGFRFAGCQQRTRESHVAVFTDAGVLLAFGRNGGGALAHSERFLPSAGTSLGGACTQGCQCSSGFCANGVCCNRACNGTCETCAALTGQCALSTPGTVCRPSLGICDREEVCDGMDAGCPADKVTDAGVVCRSAVGTCDVLETCTGASRVCPADERVDAGTVCRAAVAICDHEETCDGDGGTCPSDVDEGPATVCRAGRGPCDSPEHCTGASQFCPPDVNFPAGTVCRSAAGECDAPEICGGGLSVNCPSDGFLPSGTACGEFTCSGTVGKCPAVCASSEQCVADSFCDAGACVLRSTVPPRSYVGFSCASAPGEPSGWWLWAVAAALLGTSRRRGAAGLLAAVLLFAPLARAEPPAPGFFHTGTEGHQGFALRIQALVLKDMLTTAVGGEAGLSIALSERFDLGAWVSIGRYPGARLGVTLHTRDDGERFRPFLQLRALVHPVPSGVAFGAGLFGGFTTALGPGRIAFGPLLEGYAGPADHVPAGLYLLLGYELDVYRAPSARVRVERAPEPPEPPAPSPVPLKLDPVTELKPVPEPKGPEPVTELSPTDAPDKAAAPLSEPEWAIAPEDRTKVVTRIQIREVLTFGEKQVKLDPALKARVKRLAEALKELPQVKKLEVSGHADDGADDARCLSLSQRRAEAVIDGLLKAGVPKALLVAKGYGRARPLAPLSGPARKREKNRRVDFSVLELAGP